MAATLTKHFYRKDETCAALMWSINKGRATEALFWALELIESEMGDELVKSLVLIWAYAFGILRMDWLNKFIEVMEKEEAEREDFFYLVWNLAITKERDASVLALLGAGLQSVDAGPPDRMNCELTVENALAKRKGLLAWCLLRAEAWNWDRIPSERGSKEACMWLEDALDDCEYIARAVAVLAVTLRGVGAAIGTVTGEDIPYRKVEEWDGLLGRRRRRVYKIPEECLVYITERGRMKTTESTLAELRWDLIVQIGWENHEFDKIFPDDIPDEWSLADQDKSHGAGVLAVTTAPGTLLQTHLLRWFGDHMARGCWGKLGLAIELMGKYEAEGFGALYEDTSRWKNRWPTGPVKKRLVVVSHASKSNLFVAQ